MNRIGLFDEALDHRVDDQAVRLLNRQFPDILKLELESQRLTRAAMKSIASSRIAELKLVDPTDDLLAELSEAKQLQVLGFSIDRPVRIPDLPPNIALFFCDGMTLTKEVFAKLKDCKSLERVVQRLAAVDQTAVAEFRKARPDCVFESDQTSIAATQSAPSTRTLAAVAAFDNQKGFSYVFYNDGTYEKLVNGQEKLVHRLVTGRFWGHLVGNRSNKLAATFAKDADTSFAFYSDEMFSTYLNGPDLGTGTAKTVETWSGPIATKAKLINAALRWSDGSRYIFFSDGTCSQLNDSMQPMGSSPTATKFPSLKGKSKQLSAARVDPATQLAYFYFVDGTVQVVDSLDDQVVSTHRVSDSDWRAPVKFAERAANYERPDRSTQRELVEWAFENGLVRVKFLDTTGKWFSVTRAKDFASTSKGRSLLVIELNADSGYARQILFAFSRYFSPREVTIFGRQTISADVIAQCAFPNLSQLNINCPISTAQLSLIPNAKRLRVLGVASPLVQNARGCQELVRRIATRFTALKELTIDAQHAQAEVLDELRSLKLQRI
ncbi:MAG: hypothetical protein AB8G99_04235, partial [Planctomycetaceae bacterium]